MTQVKRELAVAHWRSELLEHHLARSMRREDSLNERLWKIRALLADDWNRHKKAVVALLEEQS